MFLILNKERGFSPGRYAYKGYTFHRGVEQEVPDHVGEYLLTQKTNDGRPMFRLVGPRKTTSAGGGVTLVTSDRGKKGESVRTGLELAFTRKQVVAAKTKKRVAEMFGELSSGGKLDPNDHTLTEMKDICVGIIEGATEEATPAQDLLRV